MEVVLGHSNLKTQAFPAVDVSGREHLVIVTKASWTLPAPGERTRPVPAMPICAADQFYGEPGFSAMRCASDLVRFKPQCDIVFDACAHAAQPVKTLRVKVEVGSMKKGLLVHGPRHWERPLGLAVPSAVEPFQHMPLHYGHAFGGTHWYDKDGEQQAEVYVLNPSGMGWVGPKSNAKVSGSPVANLETFEEGIKAPGGHYAPVALSPIACVHPQRMQYAGTYDDAWRQDVFPFLPEDFDERYHQCAPEDQRVPYLQGGEEVVLENMLQGQDKLRFNLPPLKDMQVRVLRQDYSIDVPPVHADTLFFETEARRFSVVWRASVPIHRRIQEFKTVAIGPVDEAWWKAHSLGLQKSGCYGCGDGGNP